MEMSKDLIEIIEHYARQFGLPEWLVAGIVLSLLALIALNVLWKGILHLFLWRNQRLLNSDLHPYFSTADVYRATRYYIPTRWQNVAPSEDDEPGRQYIATAKGGKLISLFLKDAFKRDKDNNKYYLILADTGMGKTTFMINLYLAYINQLRMPWNPPKYDIKLFPLGNPKTMEAVARIQEKKNTILLLDAFDEDIKAVHNYEQRMKEILGVAWEFREVVVTCRTQFFPAQKEEPHETGYFTGGDSGEYKFQKLYLSVFDDKDVKKYLHKRFALLNPFTFKKLRRAHEIAKKSPNLVVRPMLLSHIEDLVNSGKDFKFSFQVYETLIERWIERESKKPGIKQAHGSEEKYKEKLYSFSQNLAVNLYQNRDKRGGYFIPKGEKFGDTSGLKLTDIEEESMSETEKRSRSLLNRNAVGDYKFSHKSILEYFLAMRMFSDVDFYLNFDFEGMDAAKRFFLEMLVLKLNKTKGQFLLANGGKKAQPLSNLTINNIGNTKWLKIQQLDRFHVIALRIFQNAEVLVLSDRTRFIFLNTLDQLELEYEQLLQFLQQWQDILHKVGLQDLRDVQSWPDLINLRDQIKVLYKKIPQKVANFVAIDDHFKDVEKLQSLLPNCKIYY